MKPDDKHPEYLVFKPVREKCRDAVAGQRGIHTGGVSYPPKWDGQSDSSYNSYRSRDSFYNATGRTVDAMNGIVFRKPMTIVVQL